MSELQPEQSRSIITAVDQLLEVLVEHDVVGLTILESEALLVINSQLTIVSFVADLTKHQHLSTKNLVKMIQT